jgi:hypothetical protein
VSNAKALKTRRSSSRAGGLPAHKVAVSVLPVLPNRPALTGYSGPVVRNGLHRLPANIGSLSTTGAALLLPGSLLPEPASAAFAGAHPDFGICQRPMRHVWLKEAE